MQYNKDDSVVKTESSNRVVKEEFKENEKPKLIEANRLAQSERVKSSTKTISIHNYLNNRRSVKIAFSAKHPLKQSLLGSSSGLAAGAYDKIPEMDDSLLGDLENPLEP